MLIRTKSVVCLFIRIYLHSLCALVHSTWQGLPSTPLVALTPLLSAVVRLGTIQLTSCERTTKKPGLHRFIDQTAAKKCGRWTLQRSNGDENNAGNISKPRQANDIIGIVPMRLQRWILLAVAVAVAAAVAVGRRIEDSCHYSQTAAWFVLVHLKRLFYWRPPQQMHSECRI